MHFSVAALCAPLLASVATAAYTPASTTATDFLAGKALLNLAIDRIFAAIKDPKSQDSCTLANAKIRREWYAVAINPKS